ncbi:MAG: hypothetical protein JW771_00580 [Candidatus Thermoplasmatota archaeon]|nr:hypothetical protein [Candidatus Thermoplasmatota archaeon]
MRKELIVAMLVIIGLMLVNIPINMLNPVCADPNGGYPFQTTDDIVVNALQYLRNRQTSDGSIGGFSVTSWATMALASANEDVHKWGNLVNYIHNNVERLDGNIATDWERYALAVSACNENPRNFEGIDFVSKIEGFYDGIQIGNPTSLYDDIFGILALRSCGVKTETSVIQQLRRHILSQQQSNGGWGDVDATSGAVMAMIAAGEHPQSTSITNAISFLKTKQAGNGGFESWGTANAASTSWAIEALVAAGENPASPTWLNNGESPVDFLLSLQRSDGGFNWATGQNMNSEWMTSYIIPALLGKPYPVTIYESDNGDDGGDTHDPAGVWTGMIRIEGKNNTVWNGVVNVSESTITAFNESSGHMETYTIPYPSVLGALDEAADAGQFSYYVIYYPSWQAFYVKTINGDSNWWHYWVDFTLPMVDAGHYELTEDNKEILFGYLENWTAHALLIAIDKVTVNVSEEIHVQVQNETNAPVMNALVFVGSTSYLTDENGNVTLTITTPGNYMIYAEKNGYVRSEKIAVQVKKSIEIVKPENGAVYLWNHKTKLPSKTIVIIGQIDIEVNGAESIQKVEFYVNGELRFTDNEPPFSWQLNQRAFGKKMTVQVIGYTFTDHALLRLYDSDVREMVVFNCFPFFHR